MRKCITILTALTLILAICVTFAACGDKDDSASKEEATEAKEPGVAVGDTFTYVDFPITVEKIEEGSDDFEDAEDPEGKYVCIHFTADTSEATGGSYSMDSERFKIDGKEAVKATAQMGLKNGQLDSSDLTMIVLFDVDKDADLKYLHLTVE